MWRNALLALAAAHLIGCKPSEPGDAPKWWEFQKAQRMHRDSTGQAQKLLAFIGFFESHGFRPGAYSDTKMIRWESLFSGSDSVRLFAARFGEDQVGVAGACQRG